MEETNKMVQTTINTSAVVVRETKQEKPLSMGRRILYQLWDNDQHLKTPEELKLMRELDFSILICATLGWAYVTGMKEDLNIMGNEYTYMLNAPSLRILSVWWLLPDLPHNTKAWYIKEEEKALVLRRCALQGKVQVTGKLDLALAKRMFTNWHWWTLCLTYIFVSFPPYAASKAAPYFAIYLRENGYSVSQRNVIPGCANLVSMLTDFTWSFMPGYTQNRVYWMVGPIMCTIVVGSSILTAWPPSDAARVAGFFLAASGYVTGIMWTWANEINVGNAEERAMTISMFANFLHQRQLRMEAKVTAREVPAEVPEFDVDETEKKA
ncbi:hypothetical protein HYE67_009959 [Fusarium culmorum]|uniref:Pantothenate transporter liz1 n=1 Tax=Fusarium culmorum TaxID=5516 RepID=A0A7S8DFP0_FUSCU|nr:hypothetical protein HYE67_009959 [Fusarium culmorum]